MRIRYGIQTETVGIISRSFVSARFPHWGMSRLRDRGKKETAERLDLLGATRGRPWAETGLRPYGYMLASCFCVKAYCNTPLRP
jgi:hypothetical protein